MRRTATVGQRFGGIRRSMVTAGVAVLLLAGAGTLVMAYNNEYAGAKQATGAAGQLAVVDAAAQTQTQTAGATRTGTATAATKAAPAPAVASGDDEATEPGDANEAAEPNEANEAQEPSEANEAADNENDNQAADAPDQADSHDTDQAQADSQDGSSDSGD